MRVLGHMLRISQLIPLGKENSYDSRGSGTRALVMGPVWPYIGHMRREHHPASLNHTSPILMRKIESQMISAIQSNKDWKSGNTQVITIEGVSFVYLHGNQIATIDDDSMTIFDGGWQSVTTKSRLNALCDAFCVAGEGVFQKDFVWYVRKFVGQAGTSKVYNVDDFTNGYVFA